MCCGFYKLDVFGSVTGIRYSGHHRLRTNLGGFMSVLLIVVSLITIGFFGNLYLSGSQISQGIYELKFWNSQNFIISNDFQFALNTKYDNKTQGDFCGDFWKLEMFYINYDFKKNSLYKTPLNYTKCQRESWKEVTDQFDFFGLDKAICANANGLEISGNINTKNFRFIRLTYTLNIDINNEAHNECIKSEINSSFFPISTLYFKEGVFEITGKQSKPAFYINSVAINIAYDNVKDLDILISQDELKINEDRLFFTVPILTQAYVIQDYREKVSLRTPNQPHSLSINLISSQKRKIITINFMGFAEMLARIGGIMQSILGIFFIINYVRNYWVFELNQFNTLFNQLENDFNLKSTFIPLRNKIENSLANFRNDNDMNNCLNIMSHISHKNINNQQKQSNKTNNVINRFNEEDQIHSKKINTNTFRRKSMEDIIDINLCKQPEHVSKRESTVNKLMKNLKILKNLKIQNSNFHEANNPQLSNENDDSVSGVDQNKEKLNNALRSKNIIVNKIINNMKNNDGNLSYVSKGSSKRMESEKSSVIENKKLILDVKLLTKNDKDFSKNSLSSYLNNEKKRINQGNSVIKLKEILTKKYKEDGQNYNEIKSNEPMQDTKRIALKFTRPLNAIVDISIYDELENFQHISNTDKFELSFWDYIFNKYFSWILRKQTCFNLICDNAKLKHKTFINIDDYLSNSLDIQNYEKIFFQFHLLKFLMLSDNQIKAFEKIPLANGYEIIKKIIEFRTSYDLKRNIEVNKDLESSLNSEGMEDSHIKLLSLFVGLNEKDENKRDDFNLS